MSCPFADSWEELREEYDEKDWQEDSDFCPYCGARMPEVIRGEYKCPDCGTIYAQEARAPEEV